MFFLFLMSLSFAKDNVVSIGLGPYYGGLGVAYTYEPIVGLGLHAGAGLGGIGLGIRWQPEWVNGGYSQVGIARTVQNTYAPSFMVGTKLGDALIVDLGMGIGANTKGNYGTFFHIGTGISF